MIESLVTRNFKLFCFYRDTTSLTGGILLNLDWLHYVSRYTEVEISYTAISNYFEDSFTGTNLYQKVCIKLSILIWYLRYIVETWSSDLV